MITNLRARNFKSWLDTKTLELAPLTGLFGTNSSGKTSILQVLLLLKQTVESPNRKQALSTGDYRSLVDLGTFYDIIFGHQTESTMTLALSWHLPAPLHIADPETNRELFKVQNLTFEVALRGEEGPVTVESFTYRFDDEKFGMKRGEPARRTPRVEYDLTTGSYKARRGPGRPWPLPAPVKCYGFPSEATLYFQNTGFLSDLVLEFERVFQAMYYLGPL
ncbi:MAG: AAA family ATPase, partial [Candidatus Xenobia bacterium]